METVCDFLAGPLRAARSGPSQLAVLAICGPNKSVLSGGQCMLIKLLTSSCHAMTGHRLFNVYYLVCDQALPSFGTGLHSPQT